MSYQNSVDEKRQPMTDEAIKAFDDAMARVREGHSLLFYHEYLVQHAL